MTKVIRRAPSSNVAAARLTLNVVRTPVRKVRTAMPTT